MAIKLVVSDIDGTLIDGTEAIAPELIEAAQKCKEHGVVFSFATAISLETKNNNDSKLKFYVLRGLLHHNYTIL